LRLLHAAVALYGDAAILAAEEAAFLEQQGRFVAAGGAGSLAGEGEWTRRMAALNDRLAFTERRFLTAEGLPHRPWFKHVGQAPGLYMGYGAESLPGVTQAVSDGMMHLAQQQVLVAAGRIKEAALFLAGRGGGGGEEEEGEGVGVEVQ
jgi:hypothetical protein